MVVDERETSKPRTEAFAAGPDIGAEGLLGRLRPVSGDRLRTVRVATALIALAWLPLLVLAMVDGLAFLGETQVAFSVLLFVFGLQLSCLVADAVVYRGADLMAYRGHFVAYVITSVLTLVFCFAAGQYRSNKSMCKENGYE